MKECRKCKQRIPSTVVIDGKRRNLANRKFCFDCSPWGSHNTKPDVDVSSANRKHRYQDKTKEEKEEFNKKTYEYQKNRRFKRKKEFVLLKGGCCMECGYSKNLSSLVFHHRDPDEKSFNLDGGALGMMKESRLLDEIDKCDLLCHNCHYELHNPHLTNWFS